MELRTKKRGPKPRFSDIEAFQIRHEYEEGATRKQLAEKYNCGTTTIGNTILRAGGRIRKSAESYRLNYSPLKDVRDEEVKEFYEEYGRMAAEKKWNCTAGTILDAVKRAGGTVRKAGRNYKAGPGDVHNVGYNAEVSGVDRGGYVVRIVYPNWKFFNEMARKRGPRNGNTFYVYEHRRVMAEHLDRPLTDSETIHHINGNKKDNRLENLQLRIGKHGKFESYCCLDCGSKRLGPCHI